jgi:hypothetical protein
MALKFRRQRDKNTNYVSASFNGAASHPTLGIESALTGNLTLVY